MLILAGLLGMLAVGSIVFLEPSSETTQNNDDSFEDVEVSEPDPSQVGDTSEGLLSFVDEDGVTQVEPNSTTAEDDLLIGTNGADDITGAAGDDNIMAGGGDDTLTGGQGADVVHGNGGEDELFGDAGFDALFGNQGADALFGGDGNDTLSGNGDDDHLNGDAGNDSLFGGEGEDTLLGGQSADTVIGSAGDDLLDGGAGRDLLFGGQGNDALNGWEDGTQDPDFLNGGDGDDTIFAGAEDEASGGLGADTFVLDSVAEGVAQIWDFEADQDKLVLFYQRDDGEPDITITAAESAPEQWLIQSNGAILATVTGDAPTLSDISLVERG